MKDEQKYANIVDMVSDFNNDKNLILQLTQQIFDLEAKLAKGVEIINEWMQLNFEKSVKINQLEHQLADKEKEIEELKKGVYKVTLGTTPSNQTDFTENFYVIQNQTAIDELEKVRSKIARLDVSPDESNRLIPALDNYTNGFHKSRFKIVNILDQQIQSLKGEK